MEKGKLTRNQLQEKLMVCTYQYLFYLSIGEKQSLEDLLLSSFNTSPQEVDKFAKDYLLEMIPNLSDMVIKIEPLLNKWTFKRLKLIEQALLILGYCEYTYLEIPKPIVINVCVKLAQKYADEDSYKFINAVLENI